MSGNQKSTMALIPEIPLITVPISHYRPHGIVSREDIDFKIYRELNRIKAIPLISEEERLITGLPKELFFVYANRCITADDMEEESLNAIKQIILELEAQQFL
jgi:hypothetical protein